MPRRRLGVVLVVEPPLGTAVDGLRRAFGDPALDRVMPHVTLVPPVNVRADDLSEVLGIVRRATTRVGPLDLELGPVTAFPGDEHVAYLAVSGGPGQLAQLDRLRAALRTGPLDRPDEYDFVPHVTLAQGVGAERLEAVLAATAGWAPQPCTFQRVHLLEEQSGPGGRVWMPIADADLGPAQVVGRGGLELELTVSEGVDPEGCRALVEAGLEPGGADDPEPHDPEPGWAVVSPDEGGLGLVVTARQADRVVGMAAGQVTAAGAERRWWWVDEAGTEVDVTPHLERLWGWAAENRRRELAARLRSRTGPRPAPPTSA